MDDVLAFFSRALPLVPAVVLVACLVLALRLARALLADRRPDTPTSGEFRVQITQLVILLAGILLLLLVIPVDAQLRGQLLSLFGIVLSAAIALASTTFVGNVMAGMMLKAIRNFHAGDFVRVGDHFGRVTSRGLLSTEIQTEDRDLVTLPNLHLVTNPVRVVRASGTVVWAEVSLGYDVGHQRVEPLLEAAAADAGLADAYVLVMALGDFAVTYRVGGLLTEVKHLLTVRSRLRRAMLDRLHGAGVEIVSPSFMNQRALDPAAAVLAAPSDPEPAGAPADDEPILEDMAFDKAEEAESLEQLAVVHARIREEIASLADGPGPDDPDERLRRQEALTRRLARVEAAMAERRREHDDGEG